jgi:hypothetical protein
MEEGTGPEVVFASLSGRKVAGTFDGGTLSNDSGALLLREVDRQTGLIERLAGALRDGRDPAHVKHSLTDLIRQRVFQIALGYEDADDADTLRADPALKMACERLPLSGADLASQPTLSRLENRVSRTQLMRLAYRLGEAFIASFAKPPRQLLLDIDDTTDVVHGTQQLSLFNNHVGEHAYQPMHLYDGISGRLITTVLRPGCRAKGSDIVKILRRVVVRLRQAWPRVELLLRGDSHFSTPEVHAFCARHRVRFVLGQSPNPKLRELVAPTLAQAQALYDAAVQAQRPRRVCLFAGFSYQAGSWEQPLRVVAKAEVSAMGTNVRFVTTNLHSSPPSFIYQQAYAGRGAMENLIKNHKTFLHSDRTSCHRFEANQFRLLLHSAAYMLLHALQTSFLAGTELRHVYFDTLQQRLLKVAARVVERATVIRLHWPTACPFQELYQKLGQRLQVATA